MLFILVLFVCVLMLKYNLLKKNYSLGYINIDMEGDPKTHQR